MINKIYLYLQQYFSKEAYDGLEKPLGTFRTETFAECGERCSELGGRGVLVIRNPYKSIISFYNFAKTGSQTKSVSAEDLATEDFSQFVREGAERWLQLLQDWLLYSTDCYVILYEVRIVTSTIIFFWLVYFLVTIGNRSLFSIRPD